MSSHNYQKRLQQIRKKYGYITSPPQMTEARKKQDLASVYTQRYRRQIPKNIISQQESQVKSPISLKRQNQNQNSARKRQSSPQAFFEGTPRRPLTSRNNRHYQEVQKSQCYAESGQKASIVRDSPIKQMKEAVDNVPKGQKRTESQYREDFKANIHNIDKMKSKIDSILNLRK